MAGYLKSYLCAYSNGLGLILIFARILFSDISAQTLGDFDLCFIVAGEMREEPNNEARVGNLKIREEHYGYHFISCGAGQPCKNNWKSSGQRQKLKLII